MTTKTITIDPQPVEYAPGAFSYKDAWYMCADDMADRLIDEMYGWERPDNVEAKRVNGDWIIEVTERRTTLRQQQILAYIRQYVAENHWPPTVREIGTHLGIAHSAAYFHLERMESAGLISREHGISRGIEIL